LRIHSLVLIGLITAIIVRAITPARHVWAWIPTTVAARHQGIYFIRVPGAVFGDNRLVAFRVKCDALHIAMTVGEDARIETLRRGLGIARSSIAIAVNTQNLGTQVVTKLRQTAVVVVASGYVQKTIIRTETNAPPVVGAGITERMIRG